MKRLPRKIQVCDLTYRVKTAARVRHEGKPAKGLTEYEKCLITIERKTARSKEHRRSVMVHECLHAILDATNAWRLLKNENVEEDFVERVAPALISTFISAGIIEP
jgi:Zn-dependent peptidase ImmA (M78 family)